MKLLQKAYKYKEITLVLETTEEASALRELADGAGDEHRAELRELLTDISNAFCTMDAFIPERNNHE